MKTTELIKQAEELLRVHDTAFSNERDEVIIATFCRNNMQEIIDRLKKYEEALLKVGGYYSHNNDINAVFNIVRKALEEE